MIDDPNNNSDGEEAELLSDLVSAVEEIERDGFLDASTVVVDSGSRQDIEHWPEYFRGGIMAYDGEKPGDPIDPPDVYIAGQADEQHVLGEATYSLNMPSDEEAQVGGSAPPRPTIEDLADARDADEEAYREIVQPVTIVPASAYKARLGGTTAIAFGQDPQAVVRWDGMITESLPVSLVVAPIGSLDPSRASPRAFIRLRIGTRGGTVAVDIDLGQGWQLTVPTASMYVDVGIDPSSASSSQSIMVSGSIGFYTVVRTAPLTFTSYIDSLGSMGASTKTRPPFASTLNFMRADISAQYLIEFKSLSGTIGTYVLPASVNLDAPIVLPNDVYSVTVTNQGGGTDNSRVIWGLSL